MIETAKQHEVRFGYTGMDGGYGKDPGFLRGIDNPGHTFVADAHCRQMIYREDPMPHIPVWSGRGRQPEQLKAQSEAIRADQWASGQPDTAWRRETGATPALAGQAGNLAQAKYRITVYPARHLKHRYRNWHKYKRSVSSSNTTFMQQKANAAWPIIRCADGTHGITTWRWSCWQHSFRSGKRCWRCQWPMLSINDLVTALAHMLPRKQLTAGELTEIIHKRHQRRLSAKQSSVRRKMALE